MESMATSCRNRAVIVSCIPGSLSCMYPRRSRSDASRHGSAIAADLPATLGEIESSSSCSEMRHLMDGELALVISGIHRALWLQQHNMGLDLGDGAMRGATGN